jgi:hypothetical protein
MGQTVLHLRKPRLAVGQAATVKPPQVRAVFLAVQAVVVVTLTSLAAVALLAKVMTAVRVRLQPVVVEVRVLLVAHPRVVLGQQIALPVLP